VTAQYIANRLIGNVVSEIGQGADNAIISPTRVLPGHFHDQSFEVTFDARAAWIRTLPGAVEFAGNQTSVPSQNRVWCSDTSYLI
jgi:hypothetical protein